MKRGRRWWFLAALLLAGGAGWVGWVAVQSGDRWAQLSEASRPAAPSPLAAYPGTGASAAAEVPAQAVSAGGDANNDPRKEAVDLCGFGRVTRQQVESWNPVEWAKLAFYKDSLDRRKDAAMSQLSARLAVGSDSERVAARLLMSDKEGAAVVAAASRDAAAYRLALRSCGWNTASAPSCKALSAQGWARLDPDDAGPWLWLLNDAVSKGDNAAATEAAEQLLKRRNRGESRPLLKLAHGASAAVDDKVALALAVVHVVGTDAALSDVGPWVLSRFCSRKAVAEDARKGVCQRLAKWQFEQAESLFDGEVAVSLADRVSLPADQRPFTDEQLQRGHAALIDSMPVGHDCASLASIAQWPARFVQQSELQMALQAAGR